MTREEAITEITRRLVEYYQPVRIYLFGSAARGDDGPDSDLDFLVVVPHDAPAEKLKGGEIHQKLFGIEMAADIVPWRQSDFAGRAEFVRASLPAAVIREGKLLYDSSTVAAC
ncbi:MAG: nucleotidyltransferase domain-containing protein [Acidobacteria bacterium]|nr:nucleotidyltransferase domain-containing protein [Acidobacteriota bacterium]